MGFLTDWFNKGELPQNFWEDSASGWHFHKRKLDWPLEENGEKVKAVEMDREASWDKYTVYFNSGNQVSFEGGSGDCSQIIMKNGSVPMSVVPAKIKTYAGNNYAGQRIVMMETTADGYKVALADKTVLDFDKDGNFTKATK